MATNKRKILLLPGDGIGPEVIREAKKVIDWFNKKKSLDLKLIKILLEVLLSTNMEFLLLTRCFIKL